MSTRGEMNEGVVMESTKGSENGHGIRNIAVGFMQASGVDASVRLWPFVAMGKVPDLPDLPDLPSFVSSRP